MSDSTPVKLVKLYKDMYELTKDECGKVCRAPHSCCDQFYCDLTEEWARDHGVVLPRTDHPKYKFMGPNGCTVPPHLRPICTVHTCEIGGMGFKKGDPGWTKRYFTLRNKIEREEAKR